MKEALYYEKIDNDSVHCLLCPQNCIISDGKYGFCRARKNEGGKLYTENYGKITSLAVDPIEKKPLYHFIPGSHILSAGTYGCNLRCLFCQNWEISQQMLEGEYLSPSKLVEIAKKQQGNLGIAYTYNEPSIWYEYVLDSAKISHKEGLKNVLVTNGYINIDPLKELLQYIDAVNIDVKAFSNEYYKKICHGNLESVLKVVEEAALYCHVEITTLVVTGENDDYTEIEELCKWLSNINKDIPIHFSKYFPRYKMKNPETPIEVLEDIYGIAKKYLNYVYLGNVSGFDNNTYCPDCGYLLIKRKGYVHVVGIENNKCGKCGKKFYGYT
ncbi:AmmeMemoRadiSam system radical SAM enzyme [Thermoanaerobacterium thermosaccharolyticum]|uniref:AmmeMemoRadiSam system radical SAM enzyme n=1 Tax=Thermoanaerobacterium thermosaccharolyticum TaxID=1517 RepID=UPI0017873236|nr:AmmeMemoRadiSam system radical SAM enzyme [Thermoanaerobacterium thermosaccharolyticum]MBE0069364.1 AmmeMemoRadiSam system radical SAM enzyme [Thermoanaerobacterium thermosaccharolyticum]MBE0228359.1 AmmeMemoRadiSam system radical SAM enzyme [Thermoanaerobacterium thermosaccharolyticum]MCP2240772.1 pyruvate formate lyase activating enzyme [Thermoanaerobacterium thermosaccharolyticum]